MLVYPYNLTFVVGAPRSGTTVVGSLLSEGLAAYPMLPECTFVTQLIRHFHEIVNYSDRPRFEAFAKSQEDLINVFSPAIDGFIRTAHSHFSNKEAQELVLKDPELSLYVDCLPLFFKQFKTVCIVRNPKDVISSFKKVFAKQGRSMPFDDLIAMVFNYYWRVSESNLAKSGGVHFVQFERLLQQDESEFERLEQYLGYAVGRKGFGKVFFDFDRADATFSINYGKPLAKSSEIKSDLGGREINKVEQVFPAYNALYNWW
jgi:hypothetical protein